jgi:hypothetical protein
MANPPPKSEPPPEEQDLVEAGIDFDPNPPTAATLCGFQLPKFTFGFEFLLPELPPCLVDPTSCLPPIPFISLNCDLADPISVGWGGGRETNVDPEDPNEDPFA